MAALFVLPVISAASEPKRSNEAPKFGRERAGAVRAGFHRLVMDDLRSAYLSDQRPWVVGFSGGKDSICLKQLVCYMLARLSAQQRVKPVYVLASDTRVEASSISGRSRQWLADQHWIFDRNAPDEWRGAFNNMPKTLALVLPNFLIVHKALSGGFSDVSRLGVKRSVKTTDDAVLRDLRPPCADGNEGRLNQSVMPDRIGPCPVMHGTRRRPRALAAGASGVSV